MLSTYLRTILEIPARAQCRNSVGRRIHTAEDALGCVYLWDVPFPDTENMMLLLFPLGREGWNYRP